MAVTFDSASAGASAAASPLTWTQTLGGSANWLLAGVAVDAPGAAGTPANSAITAMTYNAVSMGTSLLNWQSGGSTQTVGYLAVYGLQNPATGAADTASATVSGVSVDQICGGSLAFTGAGSLGTAQHFDSNSTAVSSGSISITTTSASSIVAVFLTNGSGGTAWTAGTQRIAEAGTGAGGAAAFISAATIAGTGGTVTVSWTQNPDFYAAIAVEVLPSGGNPGPPPPQQFMGARPVTVVTSAGWRSAQHSR